MAIFNEILVGRFNRALQKLTGIKGMAPAPQLSGEIMAVIPLFFGVEERYPESWNRFAAFTAVTGGAAQNAGVRLRIPGSTNVIVVLESILLDFSVNDLVTVRVNPTGVTTDLTAVPSSNITTLDQRAAPLPNASFSNSTNFGALTPNFPSPLGLASTSVQLIGNPNQEVTLVGTEKTGGASIDFLDTTVATQLRVGLIWRERLLEEGERL